MKRKTSKTFKANTFKTNTFKFPFAKAFITGIKKGTPCHVIVNTIAFKTKKSPTMIWNTLFKAGLVWRQKINNQWIYWPKTGKKTSTANTNTCQANLWQCFVDWCIASGTCTPMQLAFKTGNSKSFMVNCKNYMNKFWTACGINTNFNATTAGFNSFTTKKSWTGNKKRTTTGKKKTSIHSRKRTGAKKNTWAFNTKWSRTGSKTYKFPMYKSYGSTKRLRRAA
jgi:hypothetical protein